MERVEGHFSVVRRVNGERKVVNEKVTLTRDEALALDQEIMDGCTEFLEKHEQFATHLVLDLTTYRKLHMSWEFLCGRSKIPTLTYRGLDVLIDPGKEERYIGVVRSPAKAGFLL